MQEAHSTLSRINDHSLKVSLYANISPWNIPRPSASAPAHKHIFKIPERKMPLQSKIKISRTTVNKEAMHTCRCSSICLRSYLLAVKNLQQCMLSNSYLFHCNFPKSLKTGTRKRIPLFPPRHSETNRTTGKYCSVAFTWMVIPL